ncbi:uncharacterized protein LOC123527851 isoform X1 [Mercenaria mercenaria]|uniref:uncharacterized protein LOC123527851 isoform X1 n=1 Tax=Mercenaria mercenaria TaxID=6596 RepID=UPI00234EF632|nr:uncharacterized protein LOC123527851 isoform X1 [Mercenaria mercenaria]
MSEWEKIDVDIYIKNVIQNGYKLPLKTLPGVELGSNIVRKLQESGCSDFSKVDSLCDHLLKCKSENTTKTYNSGFKRWKVYCSNKGYTALPASPILVAVYLTELLDSSSSYHTVSKAFYGIKWAHELNGLDDPTRNSFVKNLLESAKRTSRKPTTKKDPATSEIIIELCERFASSEDLCTVRNVCMITTAYAGFLRFDELSNIRCKDISFDENYFKIHISKSKTDQYRFGNEILISKGVTVACPFSMLKRYMCLASIDTSTEGFLFKPVFKSKCVSKLIYKDKKISYTRARECIIKLFKEVAPDLNIGLHSLRSGGVSTAANNNVNDRCLKRHGRWKTDFAKDMYVSDSVENRLKISQCLSI